MPRVSAGDDPVNSSDATGDFAEFCGEPIFPEVMSAGVILYVPGASGPAPTPPAPLSADSTPSQWALAILSGLGFTTGRLDIFAVDAWEEAEHSTDWYDDPDTNNPLDTSLICCHGTSTNSSGVKAYPTPAEGLEATVLTLKLPSYFDPLKDVFRRTDSDPGDALADLLATPTFVNGWTSVDSGYEQSEYDVEVRTGLAWSPPR